ncbi:hypothetical protein PUN28_008214 [Cardiocondyla obscurior]|uniref:Odorant receptor n=1 Tax=Cardiocondyla obscurior TaxID=286306 RepID=A0AAW2FYV3_9HYME
MSLTNTVCAPIKFGLRVIGIWPESYNFLYRIFWTISLGLAQIFQFKYIIICIKTANFLDLVDSISTTLPYSLLCLKLIILWYNQGLFNNILTSMSRDWESWIGDTVTFNMRTMRTMRIMMNKTILSYRCSLLIIGVYSIAVVVYVSVIINYNNNDNDRKENQLFLKMEFPFFYDFFPVYEVVMFVQFIQLLSNASIIGMLDALILTLIFHVSGQIDIMCQGLDDFFSKDFKHKSYKNMKSAIICRHQNIITFSNNIESLFSYIALMQFLTNTLVICCIAFMIVIIAWIDLWLKATTNTSDPAPRPPPFAQSNRAVPSIIKLN